MSIAGVTAENAVNHEDIEKQWAVKAFHHAETFFKLISAVDASRLRLTKIDDELHADFLTMFPSINLASIDEMADFKSEKAKAAWRDFIKKYESRVEDFNFGTLLRVRAAEDYGPDNAFFVTRIQFFAIEIARNRAGLNSVHLKKK
ncbi:putative polysaccharide biosynthesis protein [Polychytrium aggregatum]|uniref:putative polysaccharide biosynthesis protein n=1 Tax=Polychytrium aggregatum TaxID=110093 RepID=UPI0022FF3D6E|nr:putative polysaccharide biosynthesis protein [Polychytrium aggregatum]KAI9208059.1 putative polysaccharide biosynthesis protein [Polychytrium aggregatum]